MEIEPHKITQPFQLLATWIVGMIVLVGEFLYLCKNSQKTWLEIISFVGAISLSIIFIRVIFLLQTKYRAEMQDSEHYQQIWMENRKKELNTSQPISIKELMK